MVVLSIVLTALLGSLTPRVLMDVAWALEVEPWTAAGWRVHPARMSAPVRCEQLTDDVRRLVVPINRPEGITTVTRITDRSIIIDIDNLEAPARPIRGGGWRLDRTSASAVRLEVDVSYGRDLTESIRSEGFVVEFGTRVVARRQVDRAARDATPSDDAVAELWSLMGVGRYGEVWRLADADPRPAARARSAWYKAEALREAGLLLMSMPDYLDVLVYEVDDYRVSWALLHLDDIFQSYDGALRLVRDTLVDRLPMHPPARGWWLLRRAQVLMRERLVDRGGAVETRREAAMAAITLLPLVDDPIWSSRARIIMAALAAELNDLDSAEHHITVGDDGRLPPRWARRRQLIAGMVYATRGRLKTAEQQVCPLAAGSSDTAHRARRACAWVRLARDHTSRGAARVLDDLVPARIDGGPDDQLHILASIYHRFCLNERLALLAATASSLEPSDPLSEQLAIELEALARPAWAGSPALAERGRRLTVADAERRALYRHDRQRLLDRVKFELALGRTGPPAGSPATDHGFDGHVWTDRLGASGALPDRCAQQAEQDPEEDR